MKNFKLPKPLNSKIVEVDGIQYEKLPSGGFFIEINLEKTFCLCGESLERICSFFGTDACQDFYPACRKANIYYQPKRDSVPEQNNAGSNPTKLKTPSISSITTPKIRKKNEQSK